MVVRTDLEGAPAGRRPRLHRGAHAHGGLRAAGPTCARWCTPTRPPPPPSPPPACRSTVRSRRRRWSRWARCRSSPTALPRTHELAADVGAAICDAQALLLANHGALTVGDDVFRAWERMETLEQLAHGRAARRGCWAATCCCPRRTSRSAWPRCEPRTATRPRSAHPAAPRRPGETPAEEPVVLTRARAGAAGDGRGGAVPPRLTWRARPVRVWATLAAVSRRIHG